MGKLNILVTGSSGYVASNLIPCLQAKGHIFGIDESFSQHTDIQVRIESTECRDRLNGFDGEEMIIINLAAARFDFGAEAKDYFKLNVDCHAKFIEALEGLKITKFIHVSSVASFDGYGIQYSEDLKCDDAYRSTKYLQEQLIQRWCDDKGIELSIVYPSAIFSSNPRSDTNIGKLQSISKFLPVIPSIDVVKSLTFLPNLSKFIIDLVTDEIPAGKYLAIEVPSLTVSRMMQILSGRPTRLICIPGFQLMLEMVANFLYVLGGFGKIDLKLTPNRVVKLFSDTSYRHENFEDIDTKTYAARNYEQLAEILAKFNSEKLDG